MSQFDSLPADQKAVLQLLLRQGRSYHELSGMLKLDADAVRTRAHQALDALGPDAADLSDERRHELADWLLGQQSEGQAAATSAFLAGSAPGRAWARTVGDQLRPIGGDRVPDVPEGETRAAAPVAAAAPAAAAAPVAETEAAPVAMAPSGPRVSRRGGAFLIGGAVAAAAVIVLLVILLSGGGSDKKDSTAKASASTTSTSTTASQPQIKAQINMTAPGSKSTKVAGILWLVDANGQPAFTAAAQGLSTAKGKAYGIWFYNSRSDAKLIGGFDQYDKQGRLLASGGLPANLDPTKYKDVIVTSEKGGRPTTPGTIVLQGAVASATAPQAGTGTTTTP
jgi:hypothetical protein